MRWTWMAKLAAVAAAVFAAAVATAQPANDDCANSAPISGTGTWMVSLAGATDSTIVDPVCPPMHRDVWFCWTATFNGQASINICPTGGTGDETFAVYNGCACPTTAALRCGFCQSEPLAVECGRQYLIRIGSLNPSSTATRLLTIDRLPGATPCPPVADERCSDCCGTAPQFTDPDYANFLDGRVAIMTGTECSNSSASAVRVFDLDPVTPAPFALGYRYPEASATSPWSIGRIGRVFGTTLDDAGNIYVAHAAIYYGVGSGVIGTVGGDTSTSVYRLASGTFDGTPSVFVNLPGGSAAGAGGESEPGLGDVTYDCGTRNFYISHFGDGRIYRVGGTGSIVESYDFALDAIFTGSALDPAGPYTTFVPLGERVWAVKTHRGRLYFSVWGQNQDGHTCNGTFPRSANSTIPNTVWSIGLTAGGAFVPGTLQQELQLPLLPYNAGGPIAFSNPVSDISFTSRCSMLVAERSMADASCGPNNPCITGPGPLTTAHRSRLIEYDWNGSAWVANTGNYNAGLGFMFGSTTVTNNSAGGCAVDFEPAGNTPASGRYWASGDQMLSFNLYGCVGFLTTGQTLGNNLYIDYDNDITSGSNDKTKQGDIEVPCPPACAGIEDVHVECEVGPDGATGCYNYTFTLTNFSGKAISYLLIPDANVTPNVIGPLSPPLAPGQSTTQTVTICNTPPGPYALQVVLMDVEGDQCCEATHEIELPDCDCYQFIREPEITWIDDDTYTVTLKFQPLAYPIGHVFLAYEPCPGQPAYNVQIIPSYFAVNTPQYGSQPLTFTVISDAPPGTVLCIRMTTHTSDIWICCSELFELTIPDPPPPPCPWDLNGDGTIGLPDLSILLANFGLSGVGLPGDFNGDGIVNLADLSKLLTRFGTPCP